MRTWKEDVLPKNNWLKQSRDGNKITNFIIPGRLLK
jgi:hypothetical protein